MSSLNNKGETLIEIVLSIALFSLIMLMAATMFMSALKTSSINFENEVKVDELLSKAAKKEGNTKKINVSFDVDGVKVNKQIEILETKQADTMSLYQFYIP